MDNIYKNIFIAFDYIIPHMLSKKTNPIVTELFIRLTKLIILSCLYYTMLSHYTKEY